jgi:hypothetical protein
MQSTATIPTASAKRYLGQFCKHFAHKLPVELAAGYATGEVTFGTGRCALQADETTLSLTVKASLPDEIARLQDVVEQHLIRFAFRETLAFQWQMPVSLS